MNAFLQHLAEQGGTLLAAATCLLAVGCIGMAVQRSPIHRQRAGEVAILGVVIWLILACVPLPRYGLPDPWPADVVAENSLRPAEQPAIPPPSLDARNEAVLAEVFLKEEALPLMPTDVLPPAMDRAAGGGDVPVAVFPEIPEAATSLEPGPLPSTEVVRTAPGEDHAKVSVAAALDVRYPLAVAYVAGALACLGWLALGRVLLVRMLWSARPPEPWLREVYERLPFARRRARLAISNRCTRALSFGIWRPTIVLPGDVCGADRLVAVRYVLLHELAHVRQRDGWGHLLFNAAFPLLYFHPLYWWLRCWAYLAAELIADDTAAGRYKKESYVEALIALAKRGGHSRLAYVNPPQILGSRSQFYRRMQMLLDRETRLERRPSPLWRVIYPAACLLAVVLVAGAAGVRPAEAQSEDVLPPPEPVAEASPAAESVAEPLPAAEPAVEPAVPSAVEAVEATLPKPDLVPEELAQLRKERDILLAERAELQKGLKDLVAAVRSLKGELELLRVSARSSQQGHEVAGRLRQVAADLESVALKAHRVVSQSHAGSPAIAPTLTMPPMVVETPNRPVLVPHAQGPTPTPSMTPGAPDAVLGPPGPAPTPPMEPTPAWAAPSTATAERRVPEGTRLDLATLATSYADVQAELEIAKLEYEGRKQLAERKAISSHELAIAEIKFKAAQRKVDLLRSIAEAALMETRADMDAAKRQLESVAKGQPDDRAAVRAAEAQVIRTQSRLRVLQSILESGGR